ncbi:MAG TPA: DegV family protein [Anaerolineae bacterium]
MVKVVTDSLSDIPPALVQELEITVVPLLVRFGNDVYRDRVDLTMAEFHKKLTATTTLPSTSQPAIGVFEETYSTLAKETDEIFSIHVIGALSGTFNSAAAAAHNIAQAAIRVVDSQSVSMGLGWLAVLAARAAKEGKNLDQIDRLVADSLRRVHIIAMLDTLEYAQRGGRLGKGAALAGSLLNVKPILSITDGEVVPVEKPRTQQRALERIVDIAFASGPIQEIAVIHAAAPEQAEQLREMLSKTLVEADIVVAETGPVLSAHTGPGAVGVAWITGKY